MILGLSDDCLSTTCRNRSRGFVAPLSSGSVPLADTVLSGALSTGVTSAWRLHDATNAYLILCHGAAKEAANGLVFKRQEFL